MSLLSQNGYPADDRSLIVSQLVPGSRTKVAVRAGDVAYVLLDYLTWYHQNIETLDGPVFDNWGYAERKIRGSATTLSNHASGTAVDHRATLHPLGKRGTYSPTHERAILDRIRSYDGVLRHGLQYIQRPDPMHVEVVKPIGDVARIAQRIRTHGGIHLGTAATPTPPAPAPAPGVNPAMVKHMQEALHLHVDGAWGPDTDYAVNVIHVADAENDPKRFGTRTTQRIIGTPADGDWGPKSASALNNTVRTLQGCWGCGTDGNWGPQTQTAMLRARTANFHP